MALDNFYTLQFLFVDRVITKRATFPCTLIRVLVISKILEDTWPAVNVPTLGNSRNYHLWEIFEADRALNVPGIYHVEYHLNDIAPFHCFIRIIQVQHIVIFSVSPSFDYEFEC